MDSTLVQQFKTKFESLRGQVHLAANVDEAAEAAVSICKAASPRRVALAPLPGPFQDALQTGCNQTGIVVLTPPYPHNTLPAAIDEAQIGVSGAEFAIADTGTLVEVAVDDAYRLVSVLPRIHIALVSAKELVKGLQDASPRLRTIFARHERHCAVSFISGPSRTGDIEMILTLGVHGPEEAHAIVVDEWPGPGDTHG